MARRTAKETEELREAITREALSQFAVKGLDATSVGDIAKAVGISKQALMHHFRTKEALREAIVERYRTALMELLPRFVAAFTARDTEVDDVLDDMMGLLDRNVDLSSLLVRRIAFSADVEITEAGEAIESLLLDFLRRGQENGRLRRDFVPEDTLYCLGMMFLLCQVGMHRRGVATRDTPRDELHLRRHRELMRIARLALLADPEQSGCTPDTSSA